MADVLYLAELVVTGAGGAGTTTLRYASGNGHVTGPAETPANTWYDARITQPINITRNLFSRGKTSGQSQMGYGDLVLMNPDGGLDGLLEYGFDGQVVTIRRGTVGAAYPSGFPTIFSGTMEQAEAVGDTLVVRIRDRQLDLDRPLQSEKYAGNNVLPNGLEGVAGDIKDKPKPVCYGQVQNVPAVLVNTSKMIYQVADRAVTLLPSVYDSGVLLSAPPVTSVTDNFGADLPIGRSLAYGNGVYVATGGGGRLCSSPDGTTWTSRTSTFGANAVNAVLFANGGFVILGDNKNVAVSTDGTSWTAKTLPAGWGATDDGLDLCYGNGTWLAVGNAGAAATSTDNGSTWTQRALGLGTPAILRCAYATGAFGVISGSAGATYARSTDLGVTWTNPTLHASWNGGAALTSAGTVFLAIGTAAAGIFRSSDAGGTTWKYLSGVDYSGITGANLFYTNGWYLYPGTGYIMRSTGGTTWEAWASGLGSVVLSGIIANEDTDIYVTAGNNGGTAIHYVSGAAGSYTNTTELLDDTLAPVAGQYKSYNAGGFFRLGAPPAGQVTADVTEGTTAAVRTAGQMFTRVLQRAGKTSADWSTADITALDTANAAVCGFWTDQDTTFAEVLDQIAGSVGAWWGVDAAGLYRIKRLTAPSGTAVLSLTANDLLRPLARVPASDDSKGIPTWRHTLRYAHNSRVMRGVEIAGGVSDVTRNFLALEWREARSDDPAVKASHLLAPEITEESLMYSAADALLEVARRQVMRGILRHRYELVLQLNDDTKALDLGDVVSLTHSRYGLAAGALFRIIGLEPDGIGRTITVQVWGPADPVSLTRVPRMVLAGTGTVT